nr:unnamed protein product [Callosobruchus analis]
MGTSSVNTENGFAGADRRLWIYVGRCKQNSTEAGVGEYLQKKSPGHNFTVVKLNSKGYHHSYRVEADTELKDVLYNGDYWPKGVLVKKFKFLKNKKDHLHTEEHGEGRPF